MFLADVDERLLPLTEQARWRKEFDDAFKATETWALSNGAEFSPDELFYMTMMSSPKFWAAETLDWYARDYQEPMLHEMADSKRTVLRLGRRLGKTETMCIMILWHAFTQPNPSDNGQYNILIIAPFETQVDLIFDRLSQLIDKSTDIKPSRDIEHRIELPNDTIITGLTSGSKSGNGAANTRGQRADLIVIDEADYMGESEITNIMNIRNEAPERIKMIVASTPAGRRDSYYRWCVDATRSYEYDDVGTKANNRVSYKMIMKPIREDENGQPMFHDGQPIREGNGWTTIHAPSTVNPELLKVNPDTGLTYLEELRLDLTEMRFVQEVLAEFGESIAGVFLKKHIDRAVDRGRDLKVRYYDRASEYKPKKSTHPRILGVDWDKKAADTNMVGIEWNPDVEAFIPFYRKVIPRGDFTYINAVEEIKRADQQFEFDYIMIDAGHGETQIELLRRYEKEQRVKNGVGARMIRVNLSEKVKIFDPITRTYEKKHIKPFIVNNAVLMFEKGLVALNPKDKETIVQFEQYEVKSWSSDGRPTYTDVNEHILDCINFCLYGFTKYFDDIMKTFKSSRILGLKEPLDRVSDHIERGDFTETIDKKSRLVAKTLGISKNKSPSARGRIRRGGSGMPTRKSF